MSIQGCDFLRVIKHCVSRRRHTKCPHALKTSKEEWKMTRLKSHWDLLPVSVLDLASLTLWVDHQPLAVAVLRMAYKREVGSVIVGSKDIVRLRVGDVPVDLEQTTKTFFLYLLRKQLLHDGKNIRARLLHEREQSFDGRVQQCLMIF